MLLENLPDRIKTVVDCNSNEESKHRVFVMNMTCGESILNETSRGSILSGWGYVLFWLFFCAKWLNAILATIATFYSPSRAEPLSPPEFVDHWAS